MEDEIPTRANEDGSCVAEGCEDKATTKMGMVSGKEPDTITEYWMVCQTHADMPEPREEDKTADDTSSLKEKSDADATKEVAVGEQGICEFAGYGDFTLVTLRDIRERAIDLAERGERDPLVYQALINLGMAADYLKELYERQKLVADYCGIENCLNPAYAPVQPPDIVKEEGDTGFTVSFKSVRVCKPCIKAFGLTIKDCEAY